MNSKLYPSSAWPTVNSLSNVHEHVTVFDFACVGHVLQLRHAASPQVLQTVRSRPGGQGSQGGPGGLLATNLLVPVRFGPSWPFWLRCHRIWVVLNRGRGSERGPNPGRAWALTKTVPHLLCLFAGAIRSGVEEGACGLAAPRRSGRSSGAVTWRQQGKSLSVCVTVSATASRLHPQTGLSTFLPLTFLTSHLSTLTNPTSLARHLHHLCHPSHRLRNTTGSIAYDVRATRASRNGITVLQEVSLFTHLFLLTVWL